VSTYAGATIQSRHRWPAKARTVASNTTRPFASTLSCVDFLDDEPRRDHNSRLMGSGDPRSRSNSTSMPHPPLLRVARSTHLHPVSKLNTVNLPSYNSHASSESDGSDEDSLPDLYSGTSSDSDISEPPSPTISPHSLNAMLRKKIERLQRIFGEEVPVDMIFHDQRSHENSFESDGECPGASSTGHSVVVMKRPQTAPAGGSHFPFSFSKEQESRRPATTTGPPSLTTEKRSFRPTQDPTSVSPASPKPRRKRPATPHPHYRLQSSLQDTNPAQPATPAKFSYVYYPNQSNPPLPLNEGSATEYGDATSLQTIIESPDEIESLFTSRASCVLQGKASSRRRSRDASSKSDRYQDDLPVDHPKAMRSFDDTRSSEAKTKATETKRIWSHRRKPVPVYEP
jgi:hypothetical protein